MIGIRVKLAIGLKRYSAFIRLLLLGRHHLVHIIKRNFLRLYTKRACLKSMVFSTNRKMFEQKISFYDASFKIKYKIVYKFILD